MCYDCDRADPTAGQRANEFKNTINSYGNTSFLCYYNGSGVVVLNRIYPDWIVAHAFFWPLFVVVVDIALIMLCCFCCGHCRCSSATTGRSEARPVEPVRVQRSATTGRSEARPVETFRTQHAPTDSETILEDFEVETVEAERRTDDRTRTSNVFSIDPCPPPPSHETAMAMARTNLGGHVRFSVDGQNGLTCTFRMSKDDADGLSSSC